MNKKKLLIILAIAIPIVLLVVGLAGAAVVFARSTPMMPPIPFVWQGGEEGGFGPHGGGFGQMFGSSVCDAVTEALGLTHDELVAELQAGKSLSEIADEQGVEVDAVTEAMSAAVEQAIEDGTLTQEQADWLLEILEQGFPMGMGRGFGHGRGRGGYAGGEGECSCGSHQ